VACLSPNEIVEREEGGAKVEVLEPGLLEAASEETEAEEGSAAVSVDLDIEVAPGRQSEMSMIPRSTSMRQFPEVDDVPTVLELEDGTGVGEVGAEVTIDEDEGLGTVVDELSKVREKLSGREKGKTEKKNSPGKRRARAGGGASARGSIRRRRGRRRDGGNRGATGKSNA
jgi:hypothetical protein